MGSLDVTVSPSRVTPVTETLGHGGHLATSSPAPTTTVLTGCGCGCRLWVVLEPIPIELDADSEGSRARLPPVRQGVSQGSASQGSARFVSIE